MVMMMVAVAVDLLFRLVLVDFQPPFRIFGFDRVSNPTGPCEVCEGCIYVSDERAVGREDVRVVGREVVWVIDREGCVRVDQTLTNFLTAGEEGANADDDDNDDDDGSAPEGRLLRMVPPRCSVTTLTAVDVVSTGSRKEG